MSDSGAGSGWLAGLSPVKRALVLLLLPFVVGGAVGAALVLWPKEKPAPVVEVEKPAQLVSVSEHDTAAQVWPCPCSAGIWCQGPRGGVFCVTDAGKKRYAPR